MTSMSLCDGQLSNRCVSHTCTCNCVLEVHTDVARAAVMVSLKVLGFLLVTPCQHNPKAHDYNGTTCSISAPTWLRILSDHRLRHTSKVLDESLTVRHASLWEIGETVPIQPHRIRPGLLEQTRGPREGRGQVATVSTRDSVW